MEQQKPPPFIGEDKLKELLIKLKGLNLKTVSIDDIKKTFKEIGPLVTTLIDLEEGQLILRARHDSSYVPYYYEKDISYIQDKNIVPPYNRASTEGKPMFYGTISFNAPYKGMIQCLAESMQGLDEEILEDKESYATMGFWRVIKDIRVTALVSHKGFHKNNKLIEATYNEFQSSLDSFPENKNGLSNLMEFLSDEFAKKVLDAERYKYKISASFSDMMLNTTINGIIYPSTVNEGDGINVALSPEIIKESLKLTKVIVWRIKQRKKEMYPKTYLICNDFHPDGKFILKDSGESISDSIDELVLDGKINK